MKKILLMLPLVFWIGCAIQPSDGVAKPINYSVPTVARFNVPLLLKMNINEFEEVLGQPVNKWVPNEYQKAIGMNITSNQEWKIESTTIDVEFKSDGKIVSIFLRDDEYNVSAGTMMIRGSINPQTTVKDYSVRYQKWVNSEYARTLKASQIAGIEVKPN